MFHYVDPRSRHQIPLTKKNRNLVLFVTGQGQMKGHER